MNGYGIFYSNDNIIYKGEWNNNMINGIGEYIWNNGEKKYIGYFLDDKKNGFGIFAWKNPNKIFIGFWINGKQNGVGKIIDLKQQKCRIWKDGKKIKNIDMNEISQFIEPYYNKFVPIFHKNLQKN